MKKIPYATQWIEEDDIETVINALKSSNLTQGPLVQEFERNIAEYCGAKYAVAVNSGTSALHIACLAAGIGHGDEVITSPNTFVASANCILYCEGKPVFADIEKDTANIDPDEIRKKISKKTKALIPVHFAGQPANMKRIYAIAKENNLKVIEDAAHALGAKYMINQEGWIKVGSCMHSDMTTFSFHAVKNITTGEGGMVLTNNPELYEKLIFYRSHGITRDTKYMKETPGVWYYEMHRLGFNFRLTDIQSALGISQLKKLDKYLARRREIAKIYDHAFSDMKNIQLLFEKENVKSAWHLYVIQVDERKYVFDKLREKGLIVNVHYIPIYKQPYYKKNGYQDEFCQNAEAYYEKAISIPMYPKMTDEQVEHVINLVKEVVSG